MMRVRRVEQHVIPRSDTKYREIDEMAFASKNLWNLANYHTRQAFLFEKTYLKSAALYPTLKDTEAYQALPAKVANQVLIQLDKAWKSFFEANAAYQADPSKFTGRPKLPKYKHKTQGRNLLVFELGAIWKGSLKHREIAVSQLGLVALTRVQPKQVDQVRIVPKDGFYVVEVIYTCEETAAQVDKKLFVAIDLGVNVLATLTSNQPGFSPQLVNGRPLKALNQLYNKQRAQAQSRLAKGKNPCHPSRFLETITTKRNRRIMHQLHTISRQIIDLLKHEGIGTLVIGKNPFWKQEANMGKKNNQEFVQLPHARLIELLTYKAEAVGITVILTEESYTSKASFLDRDPLPTYNPHEGQEQEERPRFSGTRSGRWYKVKGRAPLHADVNGSYNIGRKVFPTALDCLGIGGTAVRPVRFTGKVSGVSVII
jgi:putative transposase